MVDIEHRGFWMTTKGKMGVWRAKTGIDMMILLDDGNKNVIIKNGEDGKIQIICNSNVEIIGGKSITLQSPTINLAGKVNMSGNCSVNGTLQCGGDVRAANGYHFHPDIPIPEKTSGHGVGAQAGQPVSVSRIQAVNAPAELEPSNRMHDIV